MMYLRPSPSVPKKEKTPPLERLRCLDSKRSQPPSGLKKSAWKTESSSEKTSHLWLDDFSQTWPLWNPRVSTKVANYCFSVSLWILIVTKWYHRALGFKRGCQTSLLSPPLEMAAEKTTPAETVPYSSGTQLARVSGNVLETVGGIHPSTAFLLFQTLVSSPRLLSFWQSMDTTGSLDALA